jgi:hypothetical protein
MKSVTEPTILNVIPHKCLAKIMGFWYMTPCSLLYRYLMCRRNLLPRLQSTSKVIPPKCWYLPAKLHGVTLILTAWQPHTNSHRPTISSEDDEECEVVERMRMGKTEREKNKKRARKYYKRNKSKTKTMIRTNIYTNHKCYNTKFTYYHECFFFFGTKWLLWRPHR